MLKKISLSLLSATLLALPWLIGVGGWSLLIAFVPLLILQSQRPRHFWAWVCLTFLVWISLSTWWVAIASPMTIIAIPLVGLIFSMTPFMIYNYVWKQQPGALAWVVLVTAWIAFEALYTYQDISFPWLNLGNGFAQSPWAVQWYEYTGTFGGTAWILVSNILVFKFYENRNWIAAVAWVVVPVILSLAIYFNYEETPNPLNVCVVQPNIEPYTQKFASMSQSEQAERLLELSLKAPANVDFIVTPETALEDNFWVEQLSTNPRVEQMRAFMQAHYPAATMILGVSAYQMRPPTSPSDRGYDGYNSAIWVDTSSVVNIYHKSKLVVGAEMIPYPALFSFLELDLGGLSGNRQKQAQRAAYKGVGVAICYESIYGAYFTEYIDKGAKAMFVITNDGWWHNTRGHHHHLEMARLRAIETRRSIARSANTGISAIINQRGDIVQRMEWAQEGVLNGTINLNDSHTLYVEYKDLIVRISIYTLALSLLYFINRRYKALTNRQK